MGGVLVNPTQVDSKSGVLTLFGPKSQEQRSVTFDVGDKAYTLVAFNLAVGQKATLYNVARVEGTIRESIFIYNDYTIELTSDRPVAFIALTGTYRFVLNAPVGNVVLKAYPQEAKKRPVAPVKSDLVNSMQLIAGVPSDTLQVQERVYTVAAYNLGLDDTVGIYYTFNGMDALYATLSADKSIEFLDFTGDYRFQSNVDCVITIRPNYVEFENPYITKGDKGENGTNGTDGAPGPQGPPGETVLPDVIDGGNF